MNADEWVETPDGLFRVFEFTGFPEAIAWMSEAVNHIERSNHHPEWKNIYNRVEVKLCTHSAGNTVTKKDRELAVLLDDLYRKFPGK